MSLLSRKGKKKYSELEQTDEVSDDGNPQNDQITVQIKSPENKVFELNLNPMTTILEFKGLIEEESNIEPKRQRLIHFGKMLNDEKKTLEQIGIKNGDFVHLMPIPENIQPSRLPNTPQMNPIGGYDDINYNMYNNITSEEYFQLVEFNMWKARVRLISSLMLFYYFLQGMNHLSLMLHPQEMNTQFVKDHHPSNMYFITAIMESAVGIVAAFSGMRAATEENSVNSSMFLRNTIETGIMHFICYAVYSWELVQGKIKINSHFHDQYEHPDIEHEAIVTGVFFSFIVNAFIWWSIGTIAFKYHSLILEIYQQEETNENVAEENLVEEV